MTEPFHFERFYNCGDQLHDEPSLLWDHIIHVIIFIAMPRNFVVPLAKSTISDFIERYTVP